MIGAAPPVRFAVSPPTSGRAGVDENVTYPDFGSKFRVERLILCFGFHPDHVDIISRLFVFVSLGWCVACVFTGRVHPTSERDMRKRAVDRRCHRYAADFCTPPWVDWYRRSRVFTWRSRVFTWEVTTKFCTEVVLQEP